MDRSIPWSKPLSFPESTFGKWSLVPALLFFVSAALQLNDPDPLEWFLLYLSAGAVSVLGAFAVGGRTPDLRNARIAAAACGLIALVWAAMLAPAALPHLTVTHLFESMKAETPQIERSRELFGMLLIALWMVALVFRLRGVPGSPTTRESP